MTFKSGKNNASCDWLILVFVAFALAIVAIPQWGDGATGSSASSSRLSTAADAANWSTRSTVAYFSVDESQTLGRVVGSRRTARNVRILSVDVARVLVRAPWFFSPTFSLGYALRVVAVERAQRLFLLFLSLRN